MRLDTWSARQTLPDHVPWNALDYPGFEFPRPTINLDAPCLLHTFLGFLIETIEERADEIGTLGFGQSHRSAIQIFFISGHGKMLHRPIHK